MARPPVKSQPAAAREGRAVGLAVHTGVAIATAVRSRGVGIATATDTHEPAVLPCLTAKSLN